MDQLFHKNVRKIHFIGIGGISMSGLAKLARSMGYEVTGSDLAENEQTRELEAAGIPVFRTHSEENLTHADAVVYSSAVGTDNPELRYAVLSKKCTVARGMFLGMVSRSFDNVVAISGAHGKTTASALLAEVLRRFEAPFCYHVGGVVRYDGENTACFGDELFLCEACEYKRNFLNLSPDVGVVLNVDFDHPDYYRDLADVESAYRDFTKKCKISIGHVSTGDICTKTFGCEGEECRRPADYLAKNIVKSGQGFAFDLFAEGKTYRVRSPFLFRHHIANVLAVFAVCCELNLDRRLAIEYIEEFSGVERRFELIRTDQLEVYSDYAHHPKQIEGVIRSLKEEGHRVVAVFEPHTYSRTVKLFSDFVDALSLADEVLLLPVYAARESYIPGVAESLADAVSAKTYCRFLKFEDVYPALLRTEGTKVLLGAGAFDDWFRMRYVWKTVKD